jgi:SAM-dependent methyltransferase
MHLPDMYDLVSCERCGFVFADTPATQKMYDTFYAEQSKYEDASVSSGGYASSWDRERFDVVVNYLEKFVARNAAILDIGCANGGLLLALRDAGFTSLMGLDPSGQCVENVRSAGLEASQGGLFTQHLGLGRSPGLDCILLSHVLEHVCNLSSAICWVRSQLAQDGFVYVEVPDASRYAEYYKIPYYYFDCEHINHFDPVSVQNLFCSSGFALCDMRQRDIPTSAEDRYPVIAALFRQLSVTTNGAPAVARDALGSIASYLARSAEDEVFATIGRLADRKDALMVWGAGQYAVRLLSTSRLGECTIVSFIDKDRRKQGMTLGSIPVQSPEALRGHRGPIVVCSALHSAEIAAEIRTMGFDNEIVVLKGMQPI